MNSRPSFSIRPLTEEDYPQVRSIYQMGMDSGHATFEQEAPEWREFIAFRLENLSFIAAEEKDNGETVILGWITASQISHRRVFDGVIEDSIYVSPEATGRGVAGALLDHLIAAAEKDGRWAIHSSIFSENTGSQKLHESRGFVQMGVAHCIARMEYGPLAGQWRDNVLYEKILENGPAYQQFQEKMN